jgi:hypothetical protein
VACTTSTTTSRRTRPSSSAARDAGPVLGDEPEADEHGAEEPELDQQPGHEHLPGVAGRQVGRRLHHLLQQRAEQGQVEDRLAEGDEQPHRLAEAEPHGAGEDDPGLTREGHVFSGRVRLRRPACRAATGR